MTENIYYSKRHIANRSAVQQFQCFICYELSQTMVICKGPCAKPYCLKCEGRIKHQKNMCPMKCSTPFLTQKIPNFQLLYHCPYNPQNCKLLLSNINEFHQHCVQCQFKTPQGQKEEVCRKQFLCNCGHKLELVTEQILKSLNQNQNQNFYTLVMNDLCVACGSRNLCRSICVPCSKQTRHVYCVDCRKYPFTHTKCPVGHEFNKSIVQNNYGCVCDSCGISGFLISNIGYSDYICDIFLCQKCYNTYAEYPQKAQQQQQQKKQKKEEDEQSLTKQKSQSKFQPESN